MSLLGDHGPGGAPSPTASTPQGSVVNERRIPPKEHRSATKAPVQKHMARHGLLQHDSGNEESDSLHSIHHRQCPPLLFCLFFFVCVFLQPLNDRMTVPTMERI